MNTRAFMYEGLAYEQSDFQPPRKNRLWKLIGDMTKRLGQYYAEADRIRRDRIKLSRMNDRQLADIGLTRYDVQCEYNRFMI